MTIKYLGHACFLLVDSRGLRVMVDPYEPGAFGNAIGYKPIADAADIVLVSHEHADHSYVRGVPGNPAVCREPCHAKGIEFRGLQVSHDDAGGAKRGTCMAFSFTMDDMTVCHLGDLGRSLTDAELGELGDVDVLLVPIGGTFTLDASLAWQVVDQVGPSIAIPMHYKTSRVSLPIGTLDGFIAGKPGVRRPLQSTLELTQADLPTETTVVVMEPSS